MNKAGNQFLINKTIVLLICSFCYVAAVLNSPDFFVDGLLFIVFISTHAVVFPIVFIALFLNMKWTGTSYNRKLYQLAMLLPSFLVVLVFAITIFIKYSVVGRFAIAVLLFLTPCLVMFSLGCNVFYGKYTPIGKVITFYLLILLFAIVPTSLSFGMPLLYTPPVLTHKSMPVYEQYVNFVSALEEFDDVELRNGNLSSYKNRAILSGPYSPIRNKEITVSSRAELKKIRAFIDRMYGQLPSVHCKKVIRANDMILFYKYGNSLIPVGNGVLYSISGKNPNQIDNEILNKSKPFIQINDKWYFSRKLTFRGPRQDILATTPKSLIDLSLVGADYKERQLKGSRQVN
jgi:hypothetical protein